MSAQQRPCTDVSACKSCKAKIFFVHWPVKKSVAPVDAEPGVTRDHSIVLTHSPTANRLFAEKFDGRFHAGRRRYRSHFISCPNAQQHRK